MVYLLLNLHQYSTLLKQVVMVNKDRRWEDLEDHLEGDSQAEADSHREEEDSLLEVGSLLGVDSLLEGEDSEQGEEVTGEFQSRNLINRIP